MNEKNLSIALSDSLSDEVTGSIAEFVEIGLDSILEDGLLKEIPLVSTVVALFKVGKSLRERYYISKLAVFLNEINKGIASEEKRQEYRQKIESDEKFRNKELEYVLVLIDRYISFDKPQMLAKLYLAYLDGIIQWAEFSRYAETIDRLLLGDYQVLCSPMINVSMEMECSDAYLRLIALGLVMETQRTNISSNINDEGYLIIEPDNETERNYRLTRFGRQLISILE